MHSETNVHIDVLVIGAGAAGLVAAHQARLRNRSVVLLEKNNKAGVKILMSGGTRCNLTQDTDARGITEAFGRAGRFLQPSVGAFPPQQVVEMFEALGVATKTEQTGKVFPRSNRAVHVRDALQRQAMEAGVQLRLGCAVTDVRRDDSCWVVSTDRDEFRCQRLIVTSGGRSWPDCGTTGDGYRWLERLGHTIVRTHPALVPLVGNVPWMQSLSGVAIEGAEVTVLEHRNGKRVKRPLLRRRADWLFTHFGYSGPGPMDASRHLTHPIDGACRTLSLDLLPDLSETELERHLCDRSDGGKKKVASVLSSWLPSRFANELVRQSDAAGTIADLPAQSRRELIQNIKRLSIPVSGSRGFKKAEVTAGGVQLSEVNPKTMASRLIPGLFIAGEVLDVDGWIGGYNFQAAFSTGRAAGIAAAQFE